MPKNKAATDNRVPHRIRLIETTARLLQVQGYRNTGLNQILDESGAPKGSLYHYFPGGKEELAAAAIAHAATDVATRLTAICAAEATPQSAIDAVLDHFIAELEGSGFQKGCPVATVALEEAGQNPTLQQACAQAYQAWQAGLEAFFQAHGHPDAPGEAESFLVALEGALLLSRVRHDTTPLRRLKSARS
ncbi:putative HTH-type transcriptional regulator YxaF [compost metagenome]